MMWRMLGADDPMEAHRIDSRAMRVTRAVGRRGRGRHVVPGEAPPRFTDKVSDGLPDVFPGWEEPAFG